VRPHWWERVLEAIADRGHDLLNLQQDENNIENISRLCHRLLDNAGEASSIALAREILQHYQQMPADARPVFFKMLNDEFAANRERLAAAIASYTENPGTEQAVRLMDAVEPPRQDLFRALNMAPNGTAMLVSMRGDLLGLLGEHSQLTPVETDLKHLLVSWFNRGFLYLERIDWHTPADVLEKLIRYESVHEIQGWDDLRRRLAQDRSCYAFFHPAIPNVPLIFIEAALVKGIAAEVQPLLDITQPELEPGEADTAIFYSINNTQTGLRGISFGNFLIKHVLTEISAQYPHIREFATLSPMPRFRNTLGNAVDGGIAELPATLLEGLLDQHADALATLASGKSPAAALMLLQQESAQAQHALIADALHILALAYLTAKRNNRPLDPVAAFHLANGARLERINLEADATDNGWQASFGIMVNYVYDPDEIEANHERFISEGAIAMSKPLARAYKRIETVRAGMVS
jgi:malonyl-CoA decarboxylase